MWETILFGPQSPQGSKAFSQKPVALLPLGQFVVQGSEAPAPVAARKHYLTFGEGAAVQSLSDILFWHTAINLLAFIVVGAWLFDASAAKGRFPIFGGVFLTLTGFTVGYLHTYPTTHVAFQVAAIGLLAVSLLLFLAAILTTIRRPFTVVFSPDLPTRIVTFGVYRYIRHPFYTSYMMTFLAAALGCAHSVPLLTCGVVLIMYVTAALLEENKFARSELAGAYRVYRARTGLFWPWRGARDDAAKDIADRAGA